MTEKEIFAHLNMDAEQQQPERIRVSDIPPGVPKRGANSKEWGGDHYQKLAIQTWDYIAANGIGYFEGTAIKYLSRWRNKGGIEDLQKAKHFIEKLIEVESAKTPQ